MMNLWIQHLLLEMADHKLNLNVKLDEIRYLGFPKIIDYKLGFKTKK